MMTINDNSTDIKIRSGNVLLNEVRLVEKYLRKAAKVNGPGKRLPSIRQIRKDCKVGQSIIDRAIENLRSDNILEVRDRAGLYSTLQRLPRDVKILYLADLDSLKNPRMGYFFYQFLSELMFVLSNSGRRVKLIKSPGKITREVEIELEKSRPCSLITISINDVDIEFIDRLREYGYSVGHLLPNAQNDIAGSMQVNHTELVKTQLRYLSECGHRRIAYFHRLQPNSWSLAENLRMNAFHQYALEYGIELRKEYIVKTDISELGKMEETEQAAYNLTRLENPPTALVLCSDSHARPTYRGLRAGGMEPGRDIAIIGTNNMGICETYDPSLSSVGMDISASLDKFCAILEKIEQEEEPQSMQAITKFDERESTLWYNKGNL